MVVTYDTQLVPVGLRFGNNIGRCPIDNVLRALQCSVNQIEQSLNGCVGNRPDGFVFIVRYIPFPRELWVTPDPNARVGGNADDGILSMFHPTLRNFLYETDTSEGQIEGTEAQTKRRFAGLIERLRLDHSLKGADVVIGFCLGDSSDVELDIPGSSTIGEGGLMAYSLR